jgi:hypothetical protein
MKGYEIAKELDVDASTISRDIRYLIDQSQNYLLYLFIHGYIIDIHGSLTEPTSII